MQRVRDAIKIIQDASTALQRGSAYIEALQAEITALKERVAGAEASDLYNTKWHQKVIEALELRIKELEAERNCLALTYDKQEQIIHLLKSEFVELRDAANAHGIFGIYNKINSILEKTDLDKPKLEIPDRESIEDRIKELETENDVLREQNLMMNKSGVEKSACIKSLTEALENIKTCAIEVSEDDSLTISAGWIIDIARKALERGRGNEFRMG